MTTPPHPAIAAGLRLILETESAALLLEESLAILARDHPGPHDADALFACLSIGMEKLLKLTLGLRELDATGRWLSKVAMKTYGHDIVGMNDDVHSFIRDNPSTAANPSLVDDAVAATSNERLTHWLLVTMSTYAQRGRFYNLDYLADGDTGELSPSEHWWTLEQEARTPELIAAIMSDDSVPNAWRREAVDLTMSAIRAWVACIATAWTQGMLGPKGRELGHVLSAAGRSAYRIG